MKHLVQILKTLADQNRLRILALLAGRKMCVCELAFVLKISPPAISRHLRKMKEAGLVAGEQAGYWTDYYLLPCPPAKAILKVVAGQMQCEPKVATDKAMAKKAESLRGCCP